MNLTLLITTKNRLDELKITLDKLNESGLLKKSKCIICDDGSTDSTSDYIKLFYPSFKLIRNEKSKGLIYSRNMLMDLVDTNYAISLDDDANFLTEDVFNIIDNHFINNPKCGVIATRIFWGKSVPENLLCIEKSERVKGFVGCGHIWNMQAWKSIPNYPEWFVFYGEEDFAAYQLFKNNWEVHYVPSLLVHHRVDVKSRKNNSDYITRTRRSLRAGWYLFFMFYPLIKIPRILAYSLWTQMRIKVLKGDLKAGYAIFRALLDVLVNFPKLFKKKYRFSNSEFTEFSKLPNTKIYWIPKNNENIQK